MFFQVKQKRTGRKEVTHMKETRIQKLLRAAEIIKAEDEKEAELDSLVAVSMQTGYQLGKMSAKATA